MTKWACMCFVLFTIFSCGVSKTEYTLMKSYAEKLKQDSILLEKRITRLSDERNYLADKTASIEQTLNNRLQEKQDSLLQKEQQLRERELSIADMKARKAEEKESFESLSKSIFELFNDFPSTEVALYTNCTHIIVEVSDKQLFTNNGSKTELKPNKIFGQIKKVLEKNSDLLLLIVSHTDSLTAKDKPEDYWATGANKSNSIIKSLVKEYQLPEAKFVSASKGASQPANKSNISLGRNRVAFMFYSALLPCIHSKD
jgi:flagellar motor protein MotB